MEIRFNATGARRKEMVRIISDTLETGAEYQYMPTCAYKIGSFTVTREGSLAFGESEDSERVERILEALQHEGTAARSPVRWTESIRRPSTASANW